MFLHIYGKQYTFVYTVNTDIKLYVHKTSTITTMKSISVH